MLPLLVRKCARPSLLRSATHHLPWTAARASTRTVRRRVRAASLQHLNSSRQHLASAHCVPRRTLFSSSWFGAGGDSKSKSDSDDDAEDDALLTPDELHDLDDMPEPSAEELAELESVLSTMKSGESVPAGAEEEEEDSDEDDEEMQQLLSLASRIRNLTPEDERLLNEQFEQALNSRSDAADEDDMAFQAAQILQETGDMPVLDPKSGQWKAAPEPESELEPEPEAEAVEEATAPEPEPVAVPAPTLTAAQSVRNTKFSRTDPCATDLPRKMTREITEVIADLNYRVNQDENYRTKHFHQWYLVNRMAPEFTVVRRVLTELRARVPSLTPRTVFDFGGKTGTVAWAVRDVFGQTRTNRNSIDNPDDINADTLPDAFLAYEPNIQFARIGRSTTEPLDNMPMRWVRKFSPETLGTHPLVIASNALSGFDEDELYNYVAQLWRMTSDTLIVIEDGTLDGFVAVQRVRDFVLRGAKGSKQRLKAMRRARMKKNKEAPEMADEPLDEGVAVIAPCPHRMPCPMIAANNTTICRFTQRIPRASLPGKTPMRKIRPPSSIGDNVLTRFSYVVLRKETDPATRIGDTDSAEVLAESIYDDLDDASGDDSSSDADGEDMSDTVPPALLADTWPRVIAPPQKKKKHVHLQLCTPGGTIERTVISKSMNKMFPGRPYRTARRARWGDLWPFPERVKNPKTATLKRKRAKRKARIAKREEESKP